MLNARFVVTKGHRRLNKEERQNLLLHLFDEAYERQCRIDDRRSEAGWRCDGLLRRRKKGWQKER